MGPKFIFILVFAALLSYSVSAEILIQAQPSPIYSSGDNFAVQALIKATQVSEDTLKLVLVCGASEKEFYSNMLSLASGQQEKIDKSLLLSKSFLQDMKGICRVEIRYGSELASTNNFEINDDVNINLNVGSITIKPGESFIITGTATKSDSKPLDGFIEAAIEGTDIKLSKPVNQGRININFTLPGTVKAGQYTLVLKVYDKINDIEGNIGTKSLQVNFNQEANKIEIVIDKQTILPGGSLKMKALIYDRASQEVQGDVKIEIKDSLDNTFMKKALKTGEEFSVDFPTNISAGYWTIEATYLGIKTKRLFYLEESEKAKFEIINDTLIITNIGNVLYRKTVQIAIGDDLEVKQMDLDIGESKRFRLTAPSGSYAVRITDGVETLNLNGMSLTGNAIGVMDIRNQVGILYRYPVIWLFIIVVFGLFILIMAEKITKRRFYGYVSGKDATTPAVRMVESVSKPPIQVKDYKDFKLSKPVEEAEYTMDLHGNKEEASFLALKIKNLNQIQKEKGNALENINNAIETIKKSKGSIYRSNESIVGIFSPSMTKTFKSDLAAVKVATAIASHLNDHNQRYKQKIEFGIGINSGEMISKVDAGKLKFNALGNSLTLAKKAADNASQDVLISDAVNKKVMAEVKTQKQGDFHSIHRVVDREQHKQFLEGFLNRN